MKTHGGTQDMSCKIDF